MLGVGESLDHALYLLRDNGRVVLWSILLFIVPTKILCDWTSGALVAVTTGFEEMPAEVSGFIPGLVYLGFSTLIEGAVVATLFEATLCIYLGHRYLGTPLTVGAALRRTMSRAWVLIPIHMLFYPLFIAGYMVCVIPGVALYSLFFLRIPVITLEGQGPVRGMARAAVLFPSAWAAILCAMTLMTVSQLFIGDLSGLTPFWLVDTALRAVVMGLTQCFEVALTVVLYFSARSRREHIDLDLLAQQADGADSTAPVL